MSRQSDIHSELLVPGTMGAFDNSMPLRTPVSQIDDQPLADLIARCLQIIQEFRVMPIGAIAKSSVTTTR